MDGLYREFGRTLRKFRQQAGLSQLSLANRVGLSRTSITNIERGRQHIPLHLLYSLASAVGVPPQKLLPDKEFSLTEKVGQVIDLRSVQHELAKQSLADDEKVWIERVVLKSTTEPQGTNHDSARTSLKGLEAIKRKRHTDPS